MAAAVCIMNHFLSRFKVSQKVKEVKQTRTRRWQVSHLLRAQDPGLKLESKFRGTWLSGL